MEAVRKPSASTAEVRVPPQNLEAEQSVLGAMMQSPEVVERVVQVCGEDDFYREIHRKIFKAVRSLSERREPVDTVTLSNELKRTGDLEIIGGVTALTEMVMSVPTPGNAEYYANIVKEKAAARRLISAATQVVSDAYSDSQPLSRLLDEAEHLIFEATEQKESKDFQHIKDLIGHSFAYVHDLAQHQRHITGVPTGFLDLDELTAGLQDSELIVIGARPSVGKTSLALNIVQHVCRTTPQNPEPLPVGMFSLEMTAQQLALRLLCSTARVDLKKARSGYLNAPETSRLLTAAGEYYKTRLFIDDTSTMSVVQLKMKARRLQRVHGVKLIIVDYLQLIHSDERHDSREREIAYISRQLKAMAKELGLPVVVLSQLSRPPKGQDEKLPVLSDLRESGAIEQDADVVLFIHRESHNDETPKYKFVLAKQRNGPTGIIDVVFLKEFTIFESAARESY